MDSPVRQSGTLDNLDQFGIAFEGLVPTPEGWALGFRCVMCGHVWALMRSSAEFQKEATECPKAQTSKKHTGKGSNKKT
jgi:hypothetical protein